MKSHYHFVLYCRDRNFKMKILITGTGGMLGSAICDHLSQYPNDFVISKCSKQVVDLTDSQATLDFFKEEKPEIVIHCASKVFGIGGNAKFPYDSWRDNNLININAIDASIHSGVKHFIAVGTGAIYPSSLGKDPLREEQIWDGAPHSSELGYAIAKRSMLSGLEVAKIQKSMDYTYIVSCNLFGPNDNFSIENGHVTPSLIHKFFRAERSGNVVNIWGNGSSVRDFLYVKDFCNALNIIIKNGPQGVINFGSGKPVNINTIVEHISSNFPGVAYAYDSTKPNGAKSRFYDLSKLNSLGFSVKYNHSDSISETIKWFKSNYPEIRGL